MVTAIWFCNHDGRVLPIRIVNQMLGGIGGGEGLRDDEIGGRKAEQHKHEELGRPALAAAARASRSNLARAATRAPRSNKSGSAQPSVIATKTIVASGASMPIASKAIDG